MVDQPAQEFDQPRVEPVVERRGHDARARGALALERARFARQCFDLRVREKACQVRAELDSLAAGHGSPRSVSLFGDWKQIEPMAPLQLLGAGRA
jgi:hypothetical protein